MTQQHKVVWWAFLLPLTAVLIWSLNIVVTRYVTDFISPVSISFYRWFFAFLILTPFILPRVIRERALIVPHLKQLAVLSA
ncbi:EamA family transporter, partial [Acinetobacter junii]|uniref:EamA family transporter n=2 Tax=Moraxellaceae TaxID=468 RepID=UPI0030F7EE0F